MHSQLKTEAAEWLGMEQALLDPLRPLLDVQHYDF